MTPCNPTTALAEAEAAHNEAEHAYEAARRTGCGQMVFAAHNRRAWAYGDLVAAQAAADPAGAAREEAERQHNEIGNAHFTR